MSSLVRTSVDRELERRREDAEFERQRQAEIAANPIARFDVLLERARQ